MAELAPVSARTWTSRIQQRSLILKQIERKCTFLKRYRSTSIYRLKVHCRLWVSVFRWRTFISLIVQRNPTMRAGVCLDPVPTVNSLTLFLWPGPLRILGCTQSLSPYTFMLYSFSTQSFADSCDSAIRLYTRFVVRSCEGNMRMLDWRDRREETDRQTDAEKYKQTDRQKVDRQTRRNRQTHRRGEVDK